MVSEQDLNVYLSKFDKKYWLTYKVLDILQKVHQLHYPASCSLRMYRICDPLVWLHSVILSHSTWKAGGVRSTRIEHSHFRGGFITCSATNVPFPRANASAALCRCSTGPTRRARHLWRCARASTCSA